MPSVYRVYLRTFTGVVPAESKTITGKAAAALAAFQELVNRHDLDGQKWAAVLSFNNRQLAFHRFDRKPDDRDYWRDKLDEIEWPEHEPRPVGSPPESEGTTRVTVYLDHQTLEIAQRLGRLGDETRADVSLGIRRALEYAAQHSAEVLGVGGATGSPGRDVLPDVLSEGLRVVFCGMAVGAQSRALQAYYAGTGNRFWATLAEVHLVQRSFEPTEYRLVRDFGIGLTDLVKNASGNDDDVEATDDDRKTLTAKIARYQPDVLAFVGKKAAQRYLERRQIDYGWVRADEHQGADKGANPFLIGKTRLFVLPSPSGAARGHWDLNQWKVLAAAVQQPEGQSA